MQWSLRSPVVSSAGGWNPHFDPGLEARPQTADARAMGPRRRYLAVALIFAVSTEPVFQGDRDERLERLRRARGRLAVGPRGQDREAHDQSS
jgi:hypothetical protein